MKDPVAVPVSVTMHVECLFWPESDGWKAECAEFAVVVQASTFEETKRSMEAAVQVLFKAAVERSKSTE